MIFSLSSRMNTISVDLFNCLALSKITISRLSPEKKSLFPIMINFLFYFSFFVASLFSLFATTYFFFFRFLVFFWRLLCSMFPANALEIKSTPDKTKWCFCTAQRSTRFCFGYIFYFHTLCIWSLRCWNSIYTVGYGGGKTLCSAFLSFSRFQCFKPKCLVISTSFFFFSRCCRLRNRTYIHTPYVSICDCITRLRRDKSPMIIHKHTQTNNFVCAFSLFNRFSF